MTVVNRIRRRETSAPATASAEATAPVVNEEVTEVEGAEIEVEDGEVAAPATAPAATSTSAPAPKKEPLIKIGGRNVVKKIDAPAVGKPMTRDHLIRQFQKNLQDNIEGFQNITLETASAVFKNFETFVGEKLMQHPMNFAGFYFSHRQKAASFREPTNFIAFISEHTEVVGKRSIGKIKKACDILPDGTFVAGDRAEGSKTIVPDEAWTKTIEPMYRKHAADSISKIDATAEKQEQRKVKLAARLGNA